MVHFAMNDVQRNMSCFVMGTMWFDQSSNQWNASKKKDAQTQKSVNKVRAVRKLPLLTNSNSGYDNSIFRTLSWKHSVMRFSRSCTALLSGLFGQPSVRKQSYSAMMQLYSLLFGLLG